MDFSNDFLENSQNVLVEHYEEDFDPTEEEILEYCAMLGLDPDTEKDLMYIAKEGIRAPLPPSWNPVEDPGRNVYYFNFKTGQSMWEHPCDEFYKNLLKQERQKKAAAAANKPTSKKRPNAAKKSQNKKGQTSGDSNSALGKKGIGGDLSGKPVLGSLAPLSSLGGHGSLSGMGSLPKLKKVPSSLAPLQLHGKAGPSAMEDPFKKPLSQGGFKPGPGLAPLTGGKGTLGSLGNVDLNMGTLNISNQYEEEEESDSEYKLNVDFDGKLQSKFGVNLLDSKDLSLKESDGEDVSKELRKLMNESGTSNTSEEMEAPHRSSGPLHGGIASTSYHPAHKGVLQALGTDNGEDIGRGSSKLRPITRGQQRESSTNASAKKNGRMEQLHGHPPPAGAKLPPPAPTVKRGEIGAAGGSEDLLAVETKLQKEIDEMKSSHKKQLEKLRQEMEEEKQSLEDTLRQEKESKMAEIRRKVASEQVKEEKELIVKKETHLCQLQAKLEEEQEDEEAKLMEEKQDNIRRLKAKISAELEKEKKDIESSKQEMHNVKMAEMVQQEEENLQLSLQEELEDLRKTLNQEKERKIKSLESEYKEELESLEETLDSDHTKLKEELQAKYQKEADILKTQAETEHKNRLEEVQNELKLRYDTEETKARLMQVFKEEEAKVKEQFEARLESAKSELSLQHAAETENLILEHRKELETINKDTELEIKASREKLEMELSDSRKTLEQEHLSKLEELRETCRMAETRLEQEKLNQMKALENVQSEYEDKKAEIVRKLAELAQQSESIEEKKRRLQQEEKEADLEETRLVQLRSSNALETEQLLKRQDSELKKNIAKEEGNLERLRKAQNEIESEILQLNITKSAAEARVKELKQEEQNFNTQLNKLHKELQHSKSVHPTTEVHIESQQAAQSPLSLHGSKKSSSKEPQAAKELPALQESWMVTDEEAEELSASITPQEVQPRDGGKKITSLEELEHMKLRMNQWHKGIRQALEEERKSLNKRRDYFQKKERNLRRRQADYHLANISQKSQSCQKQLSNDDNVALMAEIQTKLDQEAATLMELEKKVKASSRLLDRKEDGVNQLQMFAGRQLDSRLEQPAKPPLPVHSSATIDENLFRLQSALSSIKNSRLSSASTSMHSRPHQSATRGEADSSNSSSDESDVMKELRQHPSGRQSLSPKPSTPTPYLSQPFYAHSSRLSPLRAGTPARIEPSWNPQLHSTQRPDSESPAPPNHHSRGASSGSVMETLMSINNQVAELMDRVGSTDASGKYPSRASSSYHKTPTPGVQHRPPASLTSHVEVPHMELPLSSTAGRWAEVVAPPNLIPVNDHRPDSSVPLPPAMTRTSTEALLKKQTDWLREFTQHTSQLKSRAAARLTTPSAGLPSTATGPSPSHTASDLEPTAGTLDHLKFAGRPKLILDSRDKIQLIHV